MNVTKILALAFLTLACARAVNGAERPYQGVVFGDGVASGYNTENPREKIPGGSYGDNFGFLVRVSSSHDIDVHLEADDSMSLVGIKKRVLAYHAIPWESLDAILVNGGANEFRPLFESRSCDPIAWQTTRDSVVRTWKEIIPEIAVRAPKRAVTGVVGLFEPMQTAMRSTKCGNGTTAHDLALAALLEVNWKLCETSWMNSIPCFDSLSRMNCDEKHKEKCAPHLGEQFSDYQSRLLTLDRSGAIVDAKTLDLVQGDQCHPSPMGHFRIAEGIFAAIFGEDNGDGSL